MTDSMARGLLVVVSVLALGCPGGPTQGEVVDRYASPVAARLSELQQLAAGFPAAGSLTAPSPASGPLDPAPTYEKKLGNFTMDIVQLEHLDQPARDLRLEGQLDLLSSQVLVAALRDAAPGHLSEEDRADRVSERYQDRFEAALKLRWVALVRTVEFVKPEAVSETEFKGGHARLEVFLVDLQEKKLVASFPAAARSKPAVDYEYRKGEDDPLKRLTAFAYSTLWEDARGQVAAGLREHAGAKASFD